MSAADLAMLYQAMLHNPDEMWDPRVLRDVTSSEIAWADPAAGLSLGYCTNGLDDNLVREPRRTTAVASLAAVCATT